MTPNTTTPAPASVPSTAELTYAEAAELIGVSQDTIERDRKAGLYPSAYRDAARRGAWVVPVADLVSAKRLAASAVADVETGLAGLRESRKVRELNEQLIRLSVELDAAHALIARLDADKALLESLLRGALPVANRKAA
jgi:hypothetical protein